MEWLTMPQSSHRHRHRGVLLALLFLSRFLPCAEAQPNTRDDLPGHALAKQYCGACHVFPEPDLLDKKTWREQTLRRMKIRMGLSPAEFERHPEANLLKASGIFLTSPMLSTNEWNAILNYYVQAAPEVQPPQDPRPEIQVGMKYFRAERPKYRRETPSTTLVKVSATTGRIYMGDEATKSLDILNLDTSLAETIAIANVPIAVTETPKGIYVSSIGHFQPSEDPKA